MKMRNLKTAASLALISLCLMRGNAQAHSCSISPETVKFGIIKGNSGLPQKVPGQLNIHCAGLSKTTPTRYCLTLSQQSDTEHTRMMYLNGADDGKNKIPFNLYTPDGEPWGGGDSNYGVGITGTTGDETGTGDFTVNFIAITEGVLNVAPGAYSGTLNIRNRYNYDNQNISAADLCGTLTIPTSITENNVETTTATVKPSCSVSTTGTMSFGKQVDLKEQHSAPGAVMVDCASGVFYNLSLDGGRSPDASGENQMTCAESDKCGEGKIKYLIYDDQGICWNSFKNGCWPSGKYVWGTGGRKIFPLTARTEIQMTQPTPGRYKDTIIVTLETL